MPQANTLGGEVEKIVYFKNLDFKGSIYIITALTRPVSYIILSPVRN